MSIIDKIDSYSTTERIAHSYRESRLTYKELKEKSDALASYINGLLGTDRSPILVFGHKESLMIICFLACVKSGHAYIPVDSSMPAGRIEDIIRSSVTPMILSVEEIGTNSFEGITLDRDRITEIINEFENMVPEKELQVQPDEPFYIIYTSGSTGKPKGVAVTLSNLESFVKWGITLCIMEGQNVFMNQAPFSFDLSVMDLYISLYTGSTLFSIDKDMIANMKELFFYFKDSGISSWVSTPSFAEMCLSSEQFNNTLLPDLKQFFFCGEVLSTKCAGKLMERFNNSAVMNLYGPTEATVAITAVNITKQMCKDETSLPAGVPKNDCKIIILRDGKEVGEGEKGEIVILGDSVAKGYYNNEEMTEKVFFNTIMQGKSVRGYRTGDEGFMDAGMLHYCGRIDFQIKLNGYRIEIEDIENNIRNISLVKSAAVLPIYKDAKIGYLAAIVVPSNGLNINSFQLTNSIKEELRRHLPSYMIPRKIIIRDLLPMNHNGKVNRKQLMEEFLNGSLQ